MSIILAIEPDRRRAAQLKGMARAHLTAELFVAPTASEALEALGGRVPDVLLTAPLLPSHEEATMADYLRQLGPAAAHVQTLTIPLLAGSSERDRPVLSTFLRERMTRTEPEGCDPSVFAGQITEYLREAQERRDAPPPLPRPVEFPETDPARIPPSPTNERFQRLLAAAVEEAPDDFAEFAVDAPVTPPWKPRFDDVKTEYLREDTGVTDAAPEIRLSRTIDDDLPTIFERDPFVLADEQTTIGRVSSVSINSVESVITVAHTPAVHVGSSVGKARMSRRGRRSQPVQDEWVVFDPNQCGFPALIAKLDEIASRESDS
jgi:hypothetical protein